MSEETPAPKEDVVDTELANIGEPPAEEPRQDEPEGEPAASDEPAAAEPEPQPQAQDDPEPPAPKPEPPRQPTKAEQRLAELEAKIDADDFDPLDKSGRQLLKEHAIAAAEVAAEPLRNQLHEATIYNDLADEYGVQAKVVKDTWAALKKDPALKGKSQDVYDYVLDQKLREIATKGKTPAEPTTPTAPTRARIPIRPANGNVAPPVGAKTGNRPPAPPKDPGEQFDKSVTSEDLASLA